MARSSAEPPRPRRLVVVDDHAGFRASVRALLEHGPYEVVGEAADGASAVQAAATLHPDIVILDIALPDVDGFEVTRRLIASGSQATIVLVSSRDARDYGGRVERSGAHGFIPKARLTSTALSMVMDRAG